MVAATPALTTTPSSGPSAFVVASNMAMTSLSRDTSPATATAFPPERSTSATADCAAALSFR